MSLLSAVGFDNIDVVIPTFNKMNHDKKFDQIWEFRRRDDDIDSSSDDSKSNSRGEEPVLKKHKLVSDFILPENDDVGYSQDEGLLDQGTSGCVKEKKTNAKGNGLRKKRGSVKTKKTAAVVVKKEASKKKSKKTSQVLASDDLRIFTETVIEELRVARESMFAQMREDMRELVTSGHITKPTRKRGVRKTNQRQPRKRAAASDKPAEAKKCKKVQEERDTHDQTNETITSDEKEKDAERSSVKNPIYTAQPDQVVSTSYQLALPPLLSESRVTGNDSSLNLERGNLLIDPNGQPNYFSSIQTDEPFRSYAQMGSKDNESFFMGTGFPIPLHRRLDNSFNIPRPVLENSSRDASNIVGLRMNGGVVRFSSGIRSLTDHLAPNNFHSFYPN